MLQNQKPHKVLTIFIPEEFFDTFNEFEQLIKKDQNIDKKSVKNKSKLTSTAIRNLIQGYVHVTKLRNKQQDDVPKIES